MLGSWLNFLHDHLNKSTFNLLKVLTDSHVLFFEFENSKFLSKSEDEGIFLRVKSNYYSPFTHLIKDMDTLESTMNSEKVTKEITEYYTTGQYKHIKDLHIFSEDPYLALPHLLAYWVEYDLLREYFKETPLEVIDKTLWARYTFLDNNTKEPILGKRRFNLFGFFKMCLGTELPLTYKDGILLLTKHTAINDLSVYDKPTVNEVIDTLVKKISNPDFSMEEFFGNGRFMNPWYPVMRMFPYFFIIIITPYGLVLNLYKFDFETLQYKLILIKQVQEDYTMIKQALTSFNLKAEEAEFDKIHERFEEFRKRYIPVYFGVDKEFAFFYIKKVVDNQTLSIEVLKVPLDRIDYIKISNLKLTVKIDNIETTLFCDSNGLITTIIPPKLIQPPLNEMCTVCGY